MKIVRLALLAALLPAVAFSQPRFSQSHGLYAQGQTLSVAISSETGTDIRYTTDGSEPTLQSARYTQPLNLSQTTILRAAEVHADTIARPVATASYIFVSSVLSQPNNPAGYPDTWGRYTEMWGTATADYEMDPEMTGNSTLRPKIIEGLQQLPILSIVTDKDNLFSHENDEERGGIYIFTGPPVGDATGHGWTRPASVELFGGPQQHDMSANCGLRLHGGHGRLAEKNPKHSFRLVFKEKYGQKTLKYPLFGDDEPSKFDQLVLRCHFGNAWQHWGEDNRQKAQYTRDVWARRMQRRLGWTSVNALYVHVFLNGMYWGLYNIAERVDDQFGKDHLGGKKADIDVIKIEEDGGNHIEASEGDLEAWQLMVETASQVSNTAAGEEAYNRLQGLDADGEPAEEPLLDIPAFIDYMLINQYAGNTDWDHHNWYALRRRGAESQGFRFLCWDSEIIFVNANENNLGKNNRGAYPTGIFHSLVGNDRFLRQYRARAKELLTADGVLGQESVVELWDSLYHTIDKALYDEAARWGDYRRDVHPYTQRGELYTVDAQYQAERSRLMNSYFPYRTDFVRENILSTFYLDDFVMPDNWVPLQPDMFHVWNGTGADAQQTDTQISPDWNMGVNAGGGTAVAGYANVEHVRYADVSQYAKLALRGSGNRLRILANRLEDHGDWKQIVVSFNDSDPYWDSDLQMIVVPLADLRTVNTYYGAARQDGFVHLHVLKVDWNNTVNLRGAYLIPQDEASAVSAVRADKPADGKWYNLNGQEVSHPTKGVFIRNGKKIIIR